MKGKKNTFKFDFKETSTDSSKAKKTILGYNGDERSTVPAPKYYSTFSHADADLSYYSTMTKAPSFQ